MILSRARTFPKAALWLALSAALAAPCFGQQPGLPGQQRGLAAPPGAPGPAAPAPAAGPAGEEFFRVLFLTFQQYSYTHHPFAQITGADQFIGADAGTGGTAGVGVPESDRGAETFEKVLHALPSFGLEYGWNTEYPWPKSISVGLDHVHIHQSDLNAAGGANIVAAGLSRFEMDLYYLGVPVRLFGFPFDQKGINYFAGFSLGTVSGNLLVRNFDPSVRDEITAFSASGVGAARLGIDVNGEQFGARYELMMIRSGSTRLTENPFPGQSETTSIDFSGTVLQVGVFYRF